MRELLSAVWDVLRALYREYERRRVTAPYRPVSTDAMAEVAKEMNKARYMTIDEEILELLPEILDLEFAVEVRLGHSQNTYPYQFQIFVKTTHKQTRKSQTMQCALIVDEDDFVGGNIPKSLIEDAANLIRAEFNAPEKILRYYAELSANE